MTFRPARESRTAEAIDTLEYTCSKTCAPVEGDTIHVVDFLPRGALRNKTSAAASFGDAAPRDVERRGLRGGSQSAGGGRPAYGSTGSFKLARRAGSNITAWVTPTAAKTR